MNLCIGRNISYLFRSMNIYLSKKLEPYGIGSGQFPLFMYLIHQDGVRQETLASLLKYDKATITRSISRLEEAGYVIRKRDSLDKRIYCVYLTDKGHNMRDVLLSLRSKLNAILLRDLNPYEQKLFVSMIEKAAMNIASENEMYKVSDE
ncbi:transcriptional regulator, MarR family [Methanosalsum zhilinae DSM 4017]|uniref:Transcriptional regulator, MarR family n=1 Tax=Methanosalsum zhilinae (strain DSM 4017 / NBRC 107636 / OCM 62 / WeN5) TaxID=679901 RepID=F7XLL1_METZD|nr:MarR family winged helix-turn-helix transcriptional regulator [Methanosalsum zhilinae]AEH60830.1 transcriptional regulator, MarR family [Methanosalsum zhilinae DSM 4017]